jgi:hypothetical protein
MKKHIFNRSFKAAVDRITADYLPRNITQRDFFTAKNCLLKGEYQKAHNYLDKITDDLDDQPNARSFFLNYLAIARYYIGKNKPENTEAERREKSKYFICAFEQLRLYLVCGNKKTVLQNENLIFYLYYRLLANILFPENNIYLPDYYKLFPPHWHSTEVDPDKILEECILEKALESYQEPQNLLNYYLDIAIVQDYHLIWENLLPEGKVNYQLFNIEQPSSDKYVFHDPENKLEHLESLTCLGDIYLIQDRPPLFSRINEMIRGQKHLFLP